MIQHFNRKGRAPNENDNDLHVGRDVMRRIFALSILAFAGISLIYIWEGNPTVVIAAFSYVIVITGIAVFVLAKDFCRRLDSMADKTRRDQNRRFAW